MDSFESVVDHYVLLFWYFGERKWTVQSTSSIAKPRKDAEEYQPGEIVMARYQGKPYKAVVVRVEGS